MKKLFILLLLLLPACATLHDVNTKTIDLGMSRSQVEKSFGAGELIRASQEGNSRVEIHRYFTQLAISYLFPNKWLYVVYVDDTVAGWEVEEKYRARRGGTMQYHNLQTGEMGTIQYY